MPLKLGWPTSVEACSTHWNATSEIKNETAPLGLMGNVAIRTQEKLYWDARKLQFKNSWRATNVAC